MTPLTLPRHGRTLLAGVAALAFAAGASASVAHADGFVPNDPALGVPANKIEHVVRDVQVTGKLSRHTIDDLYLSSDKAHWISRDAGTGNIVSETTFDHGKSETFDAKSNTLTPLDDSDPTPPWQSLAQEAAIWKHTFAEGKTTQTGTTTALGHAALVLQSVPGKWVSDEPSGTTTMVVDAQNYTLYDIKTTLPEQGFTQDISVKSIETLDRTAANESLFAMTTHAGAKVAKTANAKGKKSKKSKKHTKKHAAGKRHAAAHRRK